MSDTLVILTALSGMRLAKSFSWNNITQKPAETKPEMPKHFAVHEREVDSFEGMVEILEDVQTHPNQAVIRGAPKATTNRSKTVRRSRGKDATFEACPRRCLMVDIDSLTAPEGVDPLDADEAVEFILPLLPEPFQAASCRWQFTSSAGVKPGIRMRLAFWLDRPVSDDEAKTWLADSPADLSLYHPIQQHYTANPIFTGMPDPIAVRSGVWRGEDDTVAVPTIDVQRARKPVRREAGTGDANNAGGGPEAFGARGYEAHKALIGNRRRGFHRAINSSIAAYVNEKGIKQTDAEALAEDMEMAIRAADPGKRDEYTINEYVKALPDRIQWVLDREKENTPTAIVDGVDPHYAVNELLANEAAEEVKRLVLRFLLGTTSRIAIAAAAGVGKSREVIQQLRTAGGVTWYFGPTHALADDLAHHFRIVAPGLRVQVIRGRTAGLGVEGAEPPPCLKPELAAMVGAAGLPVKRTICEVDEDIGFETYERRCEFRNTCTYFRQFQAEADVFILVHEYLFLGRTLSDAVVNELPGPARVIIDESFWETGISHRPIEFKALTAKRSAKRRRVKVGKHTWKDEPFDTAIARAEQVQAAGRVVRNAFEDGKPVLAALRAAGFSAADLKDFAKDDGKVLGDGAKAPVGPEMELDQQLKLMKGFKRSGDERLAIFWGLAAEEMKRGHDDLRRARYHEWTQDDEKKSGLLVFWRRTPKIPAKVPLLLIDADHDPDITAKFFSDVETHRIAVERQGYVTQIVDKTGSKEHLLRSGAGPGEHMDELAALIECEARQRTTLVGATQEIADALRKHRFLECIPPEKLEIVHFGSIRGIDKWKSRECLILVGREQLPPDVLEDDAAALFWDDDEPIERAGRDGMPFEQRGIRMRGGGAVPVDTRVHPDHRVQLLNEQKREREGGQFLDRGRLVHDGAGKRIIMVTNTVLDMTVDECTIWADLVPDRFDHILGRTNGVMLMGKRALHNAFPDIFSTVEAAAGWLNREGRERVRSLCSTLIKGSNPLEVGYRTRGQPGLPSAAFVLAASVGEARKKLESVVGELALFEVEPPEAVDRAPTPEVAPVPPHRPEFFERNGLDPEDLGDMAYALTIKLGRLPERPAVVSLRAEIPTDVRDTVAQLVVMDASTLDTPGVMHPSLSRF
jgi:hypothetical protein